MRGYIKWQAVLLCVLVLGSFSAFAGKPLEGIPLVWKPTSQVAESGAIDLTGMGQARIYIKPLADNRDKASLIGENREDSRVKPVTTSDSVATWCSERLGALLGQFGLDVTGNEKEANVTITGEVRRFFVTETNTYEGDVGLKIDIVDRKGKVVWSGLTGGTATRFGRSYKAENYYEVMSDSFLDAVQNLFKNEAFKSALKR